MSWLARLAVVTGLAALTGCGTGLPGLLNAGDGLTLAEGEDVLSPEEVVSSDTPSESYRIYLYLEGVEGNAIHSEHTKWIEVLEVSEGLIEAVMDEGTTRTRGAMEIGPLEVTKVIDVTSATLREKAMRGDTIANATLAFREASERDLLIWQIELDNVQILGLSASVSTLDGAELPSIETLTLDYETVTWTYQEYDEQAQPGTTHTFEWELQQ